jgi:plastocyanin
MRNHVHMGTIRRGAGAALAAFVLTMACAASSAAAADTISADTDCCSFAAPGSFGQILGEVPTFENPEGSAAPHNVTSPLRGPDGAPLFRSKTIFAGGTSPVEGAQYLQAGTYAFVCTLHSGMDGELVVDGAEGTVARRPRIALVVPSQRLAAVRRSGIIKVSVKALVGDPLVNLSAKSGTRSLAIAFGVAVNAGSTKTVRMKLTRAGRKAIAKGRKVSVAVKGAVAFGVPVTARRTVR